MQPWYLNELAVVHARRCERERELAAWVTSNIMRALVGKDAPSVDELLGRVVDA